MTHNSPSPDQGRPSASPDNRRREVRVEDYSEAVAWSAEGGRVGMVTCLTCGAAVLLSQLTDSLALHSAWHADGTPQ